MADFRLLVYPYMVAGVRELSGVKGLTPRSIIAHYKLCPGVKGTNLQVVGKVGLGIP